MPSQTLLSWDLTTKAKAGSLSPKFNVTSRSAANDFLHWTLNVTEELSSALSAPYRLIGASIAIDKGDGSLTPLTLAEIGGVANMHASSDAYGRTLTFELKASPAELSLLLSSWTKGLHRVRMTGYLGAPGGVQARTVFDGFIRTATFNTDTSSASIDCQDASIRWSALKIVYNLDQGAGTSRRQVFLDLCNLYGMTPGVLDFGPNDGGVVFKGISEGGTNALLDWIRDFLTPIARKIKFSQDGTEEINVLPMDGTATVARSFNASDVQALSIGGPATNDPNTVMMTSTTVFGYIGPTGLRTEVTVTPHYGLPIAGTMEPFLRARSFQDNTSGIVRSEPIIDWVFPAGYVPQPVLIGQTKTTRVYDGGNMVFEEVEESGYYAPRACNRQIDAVGVETYNKQFVVYQYADGSWRTQAAQTYQVVSRTQRTKTFDSTTGDLASDSTVFAGFRPILAPRAMLDIDRVMTSSNGIGWAPHASAAALAWTSVTYGGGLFVAVAQSGTGNRVMTSPDGVAWTPQASSADNSWAGVTYGGGLFAAVGPGCVMTSPDGIAWTNRTPAGTAFINWTSVTYGGGLFVAVAATDGAGGTNLVMTSPDGITWTLRTAAANQPWGSVTYGAGLFVAVASAHVMTSPDGITWTSRTAASGEAWAAVTYGAGLFVAVAQTGAGDRVMTSPDGITWTSRTSAADKLWVSTAYGGGLFVAVAFDGAASTVMTSPDGITWTSQINAGNNQWHGVAYGGGVFVAVAVGGSDGPLSEIPIACLTTDAGEAWVDGMEEFNSYTLSGMHLPNPDGTEGTITWGVFRPQPYYVIVSPQIGGFVFGPVSGKRYTYFDGAGATDIGPSWWYTYTPVDEQSYRLQTFVFPSNNAIDQPVTAPDAGVDVISGAVPQVEMLTSFQTAQSASVTFVDSVREALFGNQIPDAVQNDFCESVGELRVAAMEIARDMGAPLPQWTSVIDWTTEEGSTLVFSIPEITGPPTTLIASTIDWTLNFDSSEFTMRIQARWYPAELASL
ncbi:MAG TPA: hypothetical protein VLC46_16400 [Thermoanaerobaculia bacterium]|jgi:hypothetical protein|nr:hypothetical protein [Thermoanaerobaculia bacterium]